MFSTLKAVSQITGFAASALQTLASPDVSREKKMGLATLGVLGMGFVGALGYRVTRNGEDAAEAFARPAAPDVVAVTDDAPALTKRSTFDTSSNPFAPSQNKLSLSEATSAKLSTPAATVQATSVETPSSSDSTQDRYADYHSARKNGVSFAHQNAPAATVSDREPSDNQPIDTRGEPASIALTAGNEPLPPSGSTTPSSNTPTLAPPKPTATTTPASPSAAPSTTAEFNPFPTSTSTATGAPASASSVSAPSTSAVPSLTGALLQTSPATVAAPASLPVASTAATAIGQPTTTPAAPSTFAPNAPYSALPTVAAPSLTPSIGPSSTLPTGPAPAGVPVGYGVPESAPRDPRYGAQANPPSVGPTFAPPSALAPSYPPQSQQPPQGFDLNRQEPTLAPPRYAPGAIATPPALGPNGYAPPIAYGQPPVAVGDQLITITGTESFWNISERTYGNAGYFKALEEYNKQRVADPTHLRTGDVVAVPPVTVLEQNFPRLCPKIREATAVAGPLGSDVPRTAPGGGRLYRVKDGDTLFDIARHELGKAARWVEIYQLNRDVLGGSFDYLAPGMELVLPENRVGTASGYAAPPREPSTLQRGAVFPR